MEVEQEVAEMLADALEEFYWPDGFDQHIRWYIEDHGKDETLIHIQKLARVADWLHDHHVDGKKMGTGKDLLQCAQETMEELNDTKWKKEE